MSSDNGLDYPSSAETKTKPTARSLTSGVNNKRILIVDDEEDIAWCFKISLECAGFILDVFNDPMKSLSAYRAGAYDLLLLDIRMPRMSGFELYDKIKEIDNRVNVCFVTAYEEYYDEIKKRFPHSEKAEWFIRKPIGIEELVKKVKSKLNC